jgi:5'-nucleotidase / UDP-sugar diphosphatase
MKRILLKGIMSATLMTAFVSAPALAYDLTILHTNDFHARFEPISKYDSGCSAESNIEGKCFGGSARLYTAIKESRGRVANSILVDGGDQFQGTLFYTYYKGQLAAQMMNSLGYDAMTVGNHEFDDGPEVLSGFMQAVHFPVLMSNADVSLEPALANKLVKSAIIWRGGERIGLIGVTPEDTDELSSPGEHVKFSDPVSAVQTEVDSLSERGVNKIVVLSHSGYQVDKEIAANTTGVDVIVGGHSNTYLSNVSDRAAGPYPTMVNGVAVVQAYAYGKFLGELNVSFDAQGNLTSAAGEPLIMDSSVEEDVMIKAHVSAASEPLETIRNTIVGQAKTAIDGSRENCRAKACEMGQLVTTAMLAKVTDQGVTIALQNGGGIRASIDAGDVTMGEVYTVLPFQNTLATFEVDGATLVAALENGVSQVEEGAGRFPQVAGIRFAFDVSKPAGERVSDVQVEEEGSWVAIELDKTYKAVSNNYVRNGGDGYKMLRNATNAYDYGPDVAEVVADYIAANSPY